MPVGPSTVDRLDGVNEGIGHKAPVRAIATSPITLSGEQTIDGVACVELDRVLVNAQADETLNGIYNVSTGTWERALDCNGNRDLVKGSRVLVNEGTTNARTRWVCTSANPVLFDSSDITFVQEIGEPGDGLTDGSLEYVFDGVGSALTAGMQGDLPITFDCTIVGVTIVSDQVGSVAIDIWKDTIGNYPPTDADSITAAAVPAIVADDTYTDIVLTAWTVAVTAGQTLRFNIDSVATIERCTIALAITKAGGGAGTTPGAGSGDVVGPASAVDGHVAVFDGPTGKIIRDGGAMLTPAEIADLIDAVAVPASAGMVNGTIVESRAANAATYAIKTLSGDDPSAGNPVKVIFRNVTPGSGDYVIFSLEAAASITIPATATFGTSNSVPFRLWPVAFNDAGTFRLGLINCLTATNIYPLGRFPVASATSIGTGSDSAHVFYSTAAVTAKAYTVLGYASYESGLAGAGNWGAAPTRIQLFGPNVPLPGDVVQVQNNFTGANADGSTVLPLDDTIPQITEGTQFMTQAITPTSGANLLQVESQILMSSASNVNLSAALFQDATANALKAVNHFIGTANEIANLNIKHMALAGGTGAITFRIRAGANGAGNYTFNGPGITTRYFGGVANSYLTATEIMA